ncbi:hypothetical protein RFI_21589, partial [Reticulomyxa filosa]
IGIFRIFFYLKIIFTFFLNIELGEERKKDQKNQKKFFLYDKVEMLSSLYFCDLDALRVFIKQYGLEHNQSPQPLVIIVRCLFCFVIVIVIIIIIIIIIIIVIIIIIGCFSPPL